MAVVAHVCSALSSGQLAGVSLGLDPKLNGPMSNPILSEPEQA